MTERFSDILNNVSPASVSASPVERKVLNSSTVVNVEKGGRGARFGSVGSCISEIQCALFWGYVLGQVFRSDKVIRQRQSFQ